MSDDHDPQPENAEIVRNRTLTRARGGENRISARETALLKAPPAPGANPDRMLTRAEAAILRVLVDPSLYGKTNAEKCEAAGVSESRFYEVMADPWFKAQSKEAFLNWIREDIGPVLQASLDTAKTPGRDGQRDREMLLSMSGIHTPKQAVDLNVNTGPMVAIVGVDPALI